VHKNSYDSVTKTTVI